jgi:DNA-binding NarL/FixJ family response regulator
MPLMNGLEATRKIKAAMPFVHVLIFALDYSAQLEWESERAGADAILPKAAGGRRLSRVIHSLMHRN